MSEALHNLPLFRQNLLLFVPCLHIPGVISHSSPELAIGRSLFQATPFFPGGCGYASDSFQIIRIKVLASCRGRIIPYGDRRYGVRCSFRQVTDFRELTGICKKTRASGRNLLQANRTHQHTSMPRAEHPDLSFYGSSLLPRFTVSATAHYAMPSACFLAFTSQSSLVRAASSLCPFTSFSRQIACASSCPAR